MQLLAFPLAALFLLGGQPPDSSVRSSQGSTDFIVDQALVELIDSAELAAEEEGALEAIHVKHGEEVDAHHVLGQLTTKEAQKRLEAAQKELEIAAKEAESEVRIQAAEASRDVAGKEFQRAVEIKRRNHGAVTQTELDKLRLAEKHAGLQVTLAKHEHGIAQITQESKQVQVDLANAMLDRRKITAPVDGKIVEIYRHKGEWVKPGEPVFRIINLRRLRILGLVDANQYLPQQVEGRSVSIAVEIRRPSSEGGGFDYRPFTPAPGKQPVVTFAKQEIETNNRFKIMIEVENVKDANGDWQLLPGQSVRLTLHLDQPPLN